VGSINTFEASNRKPNSVWRGIDIKTDLRKFRLGRESRDMGLFKDDDGKGYLLTEDVSIHLTSAWSLNRY
jgi:hypothetical protein